ncbi:MAG: hypothetical protein PHU56_01000 [Candidatus Pacebacteria bacterium]|nr:hypothetical protein [Candidatus Paceibacterota bacterium]
MLSDIVKFFKRRKDSLILALFIFLLCLLSFGLGVIFQANSQKRPLEIIESGQQSFSQI